MKQEYFPPEIDQFKHGARMDARMLMLDILKAHPLVAGVEDGEDSQGRSRFRLQAPKEVVDRAAEIADLAVQQGEERGWIKPVTLTFEEAMKEGGRLEAVKREASFGDLLRPKKKS